MVDRCYEEMARFLKALAHPARLQILSALRQEEVCVCHLEALLSKPQAYVSQQLALLREAGLVQYRKDGQRVYYAIANDRLSPLLDELLGQPTIATQLDRCRCPACQALRSAHKPGQSSCHDVLGT